MHPCLHNHPSPLTIVSCPPYCSLHHPHPSHLSSNRRTDEMSSLSLCLHLFPVQNHNLISGYQSAPDKIRRYYLSHLLYTLLPVNHPCHWSSADAREWLPRYPISSSHPDIHKHPLCQRKHYTTALHHPQIQTAPPPAEPVHSLLSPDLPEP